jgi:hypothetical protein
VVVDPTVNPSTTTPVPLEEAFLVPVTLTTMVCEAEGNPVNAFENETGDEA